MGTWVQIWQGPTREEAEVLLETSDEAIVELVRRALSNRLDGAGAVRKTSSRRLRGEGARTLELRDEEREPLAGGAGA